MANQGWSAFFRPQLYEPGLGSNVHSIDKLIAQEKAQSPVPPPTTLGGRPPRGRMEASPVVLYPNEIGPKQD